MVIWNHVILCENMVNIYFFLSWFLQTTLFYTGVSQCLILMHGCQRAKLRMREIKMICNRHQAWGTSNVSGHHSKVSYLNHFLNKNVTTKDLQIEVRSNDPYMCGKSPSMKPITRFVASDNYWMVLSFLLFILFMH